MKDPPRRTGDLVLDTEVYLSWLEYTSSAELEASRHDATVDDDRREAHQ